MTGKNVEISAALAKNIDCFSIGCVDFSQSRHIILSVIKEAKNIKKGDKHAYCCWY
jgi:hypothetical protein